jgi:hypothetical protein
MRLIDADEMIKGLSKFITCKLGEIKAVDIKKFINKQPTVEPNQWIPCSERLPTNQAEKWWRTTEYLTCSKDGIIQVLCYSDGWNCSFLNEDMDVWRGNEIKGVIAWMPLPQAYTGKESD